MSHRKNVAMLDVMLGNEARAADGLSLGMSAAVEPAGSVTLNGYVPGGEFHTKLTAIAISR
ncbi:hypothetical protein Arad_12450 (plasmid) [Rhizobium rhizogenes K84]|uniref:Uncharacterized protein n=1 Tax=Rhizobium rhizogenes (strain K84 / ATCC BAA-868) TaxID=311403 RepID=B9JQJ3_RHIR8|nr:hypothetical protein Arad_12450 [Rhizobium rhizogenes K84]